MRPTAEQSNPRAKHPMNKRDAYKSGIESGYEAGQYGEFSLNELCDEESFAAACGEICENKRQFADSVTYDMANEPNSESLFDAFDAGESRGISLAWHKEGYAKRAEKRQALADALQSDWDGLKVNDLSEVPSKTP